MYYLRLIQRFIKLNIQMSLAYRADTWINMALNLMWIGWELLSLSIIFNNTDTLGGWGPGELVALLGVWRLVNTFMMVIVWPNTEKFNQSVRDGSMDYTLLQPADSLFITSFSRITIWRLWDLLLALVLIGIGIHLTGEVATAANILLFLLLVLSGTLVIYSLWIVLIAFTFWFTKFDNNVTIMQALMDSGRYPVTIYPPWLQVIVTYLIPIALATSIPLQALRGELGLQQVVIFLGVGIVSFAVATRVWKAGVKQYSSASS